MAYLHLYPRLSVIIPSYNSEKYIEGAIKSIIEQDYPNLELILIDGGSIDNTFQVVKKYERYFSCIISEKDNGQSDAINKGFGRATGDIVAWLNTDDMYLPGCFSAVVNYLNKHTEIDMIFGDQVDIDAEGNVFRSLRSLPFNKVALILKIGTIPSPACFWRRRVIDKIGYLDESLYWTMDYEFFLRAAFSGIKIAHTPVPLAMFRYHLGSKTVQGNITKDKREAEIRKVQGKYENEVSQLTLRVSRPFFKLLKIFINIDRYFFNKRFYIKRISNLIIGKNESF